MAQRAAKKGGGGFTDRIIHHVHSMSPRDPHDLLLPPFFRVIDHRVRPCLLSTDTTLRLGAGRRYHFAAQVSLRQLAMIAKGQRDAHA